MDVARRSRARTVRAGIALGIALTATAAWWSATWWGGGRPVPAPAGLPDPGLVVAWGVRACDAGALLAAVAVTGGLLVSAYLAVDRPGTPDRALRSATRWAVAWAALVAGEAVLESAESRGVPLDQLPAQGVVAAVREVAGTVDPASAGALGLLLLVAATPRAAGRTRLSCALVAALTAAILLTVDGHSASGEEVLQAAVIVHVVAALLWTGGLAALVVHVRHRTADLAVALPRFSRVAGWSYLAVAASGVLAATAVLPMSSAAWTSGYGGIVLAKVAVLGLLGIAGAAQRRVTMVRIAQGRPRSFVVVGTAELALMGIATGLASTLSRSPATTGVAGPHGHLTASGTDLTWAGLVTDARPNAVVLVTLAAALAWYVAGVRALRRARGHWATRLTACFTAGVVLVSVATCSGLATQAHLRPSALVTQLMLVLVVVPVLLIGGRPERLGLVRWAPAAASPASGAVASCTLLLLLQHSSLASWALASPWRHLALVLAALACGLLLWAPVLAPRDHGTPHLERAGWLLVVAATLAILTARLRTGTEVLAGESFLRVQLSGVDVVADQQRAALASGVAAALVILCAVATALRRSGSGRDRYPGSPGGQARMRTTPRSSSASIAP